ncbi:peptidoglycan endopeptidase [Xylanimonas allomyrinae]|uniref:Peptidoglycan endopeptidase n=1 Tax=Xylanimonas allomyrinae TaxID=2509459 RepID=A0A4P6EMH4_9MICO|nr:C40 family peptidase [Xylanimonas allomyrinae]QAY64070.1 peptidoglycan endopeptidase [Xylanimonas allomyrinae]
MPTVGAHEWRGTARRLPHPFPICGIEDFRELTPHRTPPRRARPAVDPDRRDPCRRRRGSQGGGAQCRRRRHGRGHRVLGHRARGCRAARGETSGEAGLRLESLPAVTADGPGAASDAIRLAEARAGGGRGESLDLATRVEKLTEQAVVALSAAPTVVVPEQTRIDVERMEDDDVVATIEVTPAPPPPAPRPQPARAAAASRTAERPAPVTGARSAAASIAMRYIGVPYVFGSSNPAVGFDCSGLLVHVFRQIGVNLPHQSTRIRDSALTQRISRADARPGDIIWSPGHVTIYLGGGRQIEATRPGETVRTSHLWQSNPVFLRVI